MDQGNDILSNLRFSRRQVTKRQFNIGASVPQVKSKVSISKVSPIAEYVVKSPFRVPEGVRAVHSPANTSNKSHQDLAEISRSSPLALIVENDENGVLEDDDVDTSNTGSLTEILTGGIKEPVSQSRGNKAPPHGNKAPPYGNKAPPLEETPPPGDVSVSFLSSTPKPGQKQLSRRRPVSSKVKPRSSSARGVRQRSRRDGTDSESQNENSAPRQPESTTKVAKELEAEIERVRLNKRKKRTITMETSNEDDSSESVDNIEQNKDGIESKGKNIVKSKPAVIKEVIHPKSAEKKRKLPGVANKQAKRKNVIENEVENTVSSKKQKVTGNRSVQSEPHTNETDDEDSVMTVQPTKDTMRTGSKNKGTNNKGHLNGVTPNTIAGQVRVTTRTRKNVSNINKDMTITDQSMSGAGPARKMSKMATQRQARSKGRAKDMDESLWPDQTMMVMEVDGVKRTRADLVDLDVVLNMATEMLESQMDICESHKEQLAVRHLEKYLSQDITNMINGVQHVRLLQTKIRKSNQSIKQKQKSLMAEQRAKIEAEEKSMSAASEVQTNENIKTINNCLSDLRALIANC